MISKCTTGCPMVDPSIPRTPRTDASPKESDPAGTVRHSGRLLHREGQLGLPLRPVALLHRADPVPLEVGPRRQSLVLDPSEQSSPRRRQVGLGVVAVGTDVDEGRVAASGQGRRRRVLVDGHAELELPRLAGRVDLEEADERRATGPDALPAEPVEQLWEGAVDRPLDGAFDALAQPEV